MSGLQEDRTRLRVRRAHDLHARTVARGKGEGLPHHATSGHPWSGCAGGESTAFSGDRAHARRKAVDAPEAPDPRCGGASAPLPKHCPFLAPWRSLAAVCGRVLRELDRQHGAPDVVAPQAGPTGKRRRGA
jgi:hypothetical protein